MPTQTNDNYFKTVKLRLLQVIHLFVCFLSVTAVVVIAVKSSNMFEYAVAFLLVSAKINMWTSTKSECILTRLEAQIKGDLNIQPFIQRAINGSLFKEWLNFF